MQFAVIRFAGKQFLVSPETKFEVNGTWGVENDEVIITDVLLLGDDAGALEVGAPLLSNQQIVAKVVSAGKGEKIMVSKFKAKSRYRRTTGFRPHLTVLQVVSVGATKKAAVTSEANEEPKAPKAPRAKKAATK